MHWLPYGDHHQHVGLLFIIGWSVSMLLGAVFLVWLWELNA